MKNIGILGAGKIGSTIHAYLKTTEHNVTVADKIGSDEVQALDVFNKKELDAFVSKQDIIVSAAPYDANPLIADSCNENNVAYFDLTEDTKVTDHIKTFKSDVFMMPQCGFAPGAINIVASNLMKQFERVDKVNMRGGALPKYPNNKMSYYLTWSTSGLINEYINDCDVIRNGKHIKTQPLDGLETIYIDGDKYDAFNTSGGAASMCETFEGKVKTLDYKTIRYPGHHTSMKFLLDDLNLKHNKEKFIDLFDQEVPYTTSDVIVMFCSVVGIKDGTLQEVTYSKKIYGDDNFSAIQRTTASGMCAIVLAYAEGKLTGKGFQRQEDVPLETFLSNKFGKLYE